METLKRIHDLVQVELTENPAARKSDITLILGVFKRQGIDASKSFESLAESGSLRQMESITRARRKIQEQHPELKDAGTAELRAEREETFKEYAAANK